MMHSRTHRRRHGALLACATALALTLAACSGGASGDGSEAGSDTGAGTEGSAGGGVLQAAELLDISSLDPHKGSAGHDHIKLYPMFDMLIDFSNEDLTPQPNLATDWEFTDETTFVMGLQEGVTFHDGTEFSAEAVKFNLERIMSGEEGITIGDNLSSVESVEVIDDYTVQLNLNEPNTALPLILADRAGMMVSPTAAREGNLEEHPVGAGPFKFVEYAPNDRLVLERNEDYWDEENAPSLEGIEFNIIPDDSARLNAVLSGDVDFAHSLRPQDLERLNQQENLEALSEPTVAYWKFYLNTSIEPFDSQQVRQAINYAIDREALVDAFYEEGGQPAWMGMPPNHWAHTEDLAGYYEHDPERARELLAEAGYEDGFSFEVVFPPGSSDERRMEIVRSDLAEVGIEMEMLPTEQTQQIAMFFEEKSVPAFHNQWTGRTDPELTYRLLYSPDAFFNPGGLEVPGLMDALDQAIAVEDLEERASAYAHAQELLLESAAEIPLYYVQSPWAWNDSVEGIEFNLLGKPRFDGVSLSE